VKCAAEFSQGDILKLSNAFARDAEFHANLLEGLGFVTVESKTRVDNLALAVVEDIEQVAHLVTEILVAKLLKWCLSLFVADDVPERGIVFVAERLIQ
jgi:hypothetical protein